MKITINGVSTFAEKEYDANKSTSQNILNFGKWLASSVVNITIMMSGYIVCSLLIELFRLAATDVMGVPQSFIERFVVGSSYCLGAIFSLHLMFGFRKSWNIHVEK